MNSLKFKLGDSRVRISCRNAMGALASTSYLLLYYTILVIPNTDKAVSNTGKLSQ